MINDNFRKVLEVTSELAKPFEGLHKVVPDNPDKIVAYHDPVGYPTIAYGHLLSKIAWEDLKKYKSMTRAECDEMLKNDITKSALLAMQLSPTLVLPKNLLRWASITDFVFNCGNGNYSISTLKRKVDAEDWREASEQIKRWDKAGGKKLAGLTRRRLAESLLLLKEI